MLDGGEAAVLGCAVSTEVDDQSGANQVGIEEVQENELRRFTASQQNRILGLFEQQRKRRREISKVVIQNKTFWVLVGQRPE